MSELIPDLSAEDFETFRQLVKDAITERKADADVSAGSAIEGLLINNEAALAGGHINRLEQLQLSSSLAAITEGLVEVDDALVDQLVSNYFITRQTATEASGTARVITRLDTGYVLPNGYAFTSGGLVFSTQEDIRIYSTSATVSEGSSVRRLVARTDGLFEFTISITADAAGSESQLAAGTTLTISDPLDGMTSADVVTDFTGGDDQETNEELLARASAGVTAKTLGGPDHIQSALSSAFSGILTTAIGIGSPLMLRDRGNVFGLSTGAHEDIYCRTTNAPVTQELTIVGQAFDAQRSVGLTIPRQQAAGVYRVSGIRPSSVAGIGGVTPTSVEHLLRSDLAFQPTILSQTDMAFAGVSDLRVVFTDNESETLNQGDEVEYTVTVIYMPSIASVTNWVFDPAVRPVGRDLLPRAAVMADLLISLTVDVPVGQPTPALDEIQGAVSDAVASLGFGSSRLGSYRIFAAIDDILGNSSVSGLRIEGQIYAPTGVDLTLPPGETVEIPTDEANLVTPANTLFSCAASNVEVSFVSV